MFGLQVLEMQKVECDRVKVLYRLLQTDLVSTIGESVALGAAGIIMWGEAVYASSKVSVHALIMKRTH